MKNLFLHIVLSGIIFSTTAQDITLSGVYRGKDIYVQNPYVNVEGGTYCINSITLNGQKVIDEPVSSAVKITLSHLAIDAPVSILTRHSSLCIPKVLNA